MPPSVMARVVPPLPVLRLIRTDSPLPAAATVRLGDGLDPAAASASMCGEESGAADCCEVPPQLETSRKAAHMTDSSAGCETLFNGAPWDMEGLPGESMTAPGLR